ncbi:hypothetical protein KJ877_02440 [bacterium]|nr:hypothetical protein [bacterium]MBU1990652.1 hypothetical protein [bacterium]
MIKSILFLLFVLVFNGCIGFSNGLQKEVKPNQKTFEEEDTYILFALRAEQLKEYEAAASMFNTLYEKSNKKEYLYHSLQNYLVSGNNEAAIQKVDDVSGGSFDDFSLIRIKIVALMQLEKLEEAKSLAIQLVSLSNEVDDYTLVSDIYIKQKKYDTAIKYLESAYAKNYNEIVLDKMSIVLYVNLQRKKDAIAQLETHSRVHGCSKIICSRLIGFYSNENNIEGLLSTYLRLYELEKDEQIARKIIQIYGYKKDYMNLIEFLERSNSDDALLLEFYAKYKKYKEASLLAQKLYSKTYEVSYLGQSAIFEYESSINKNDKKMLQKVIDKLHKVLKIEESALYLNYLGYIMIDHEIDVKKGIAYVKKALLVEPKSAYYLDSLAWGYYKLGECKRAHKIIKEVLGLEGGDDLEVLSHYKAIEQCLKLKTKKGKGTK